MSDTLLSVQSLTKNYQNSHRIVRALSDINFSLKSGEIIGITGPSGCGKSTLARCILRLIEPDNGNITLNGVDLRKLSAKELRSERRHMQMVFQNSADSFHRYATVRGTIADPIRIHKIVPKHARNDEVARLISIVGLDENLLDKPMNQLSGGQRQRVAIARAISTRPKVLIMDEAVSALDMISKRHILDLIAKLQRHINLACLFISHDFAAINAICHRVIVMNSGEIVETGETRDVITSPQHPVTEALIAAVPKMQVTTPYGLDRK